MLPRGLGNRYSKLKATFNAKRPRRSRAASAPARAAGRLHSQACRPLAPAAPPPAQTSPPGRSENALGMALQAGRKLNPCAAVQPAEIGGSTTGTAAGAIGTIGRRQTWHDDWTGRKEISLANANNRSRTKRNSCSATWQPNGWHTRKANNGNANNSRRIDSSVQPSRPGASTGTNTPIHTTRHLERTCADRRGTENETQF